MWHLYVPILFVWHHLNGEPEREIVFCGAIFVTVQKHIPSIFCHLYNSVHETQPLFYHQTSQLSCFNGAFHNDLCLDVLTTGWNKQILISESLAVLLLDYFLFIEERMKIIHYWNCEETHEQQKIKIH